MTDVIVLNGGSSSGKSAIARCLQAELPQPWLSLSVDTLVEAMPAQLHDGIEFDADGSVYIGEAFRTLEDAWMRGVAAMVRAGARVIIDDVFLSGPTSQGHWESALAGLPVLWVGVHCDASVAEARELARGDRPVGMARSQAVVAHKDVHYDFEVDTTACAAVECARAIAARLG